MRIIINNDCNTQDAYLELINKVLDEGAKIENVNDNAEVSISIVNNEKIQELNNKYRQVDKATDVLSFPMFESDELSSENLLVNNIFLLGDIIISIDKAIEQAHEYGHSIEREIGFLAVHGFLHLIGYDHIDCEDGKIMFAKQDEILSSVGLMR